MSEQRRQASLEAEAALLAFIAKFGRDLWPEDKRTLESAVFTLRRYE